MSQARHDKSENESQQQKRRHNPTRPKRPALTHFVCLPLVNQESRPSIKMSLERFRDNICLDKRSRITLPRKSVRPPGSLHLTLGVMSLDQSALQRAAQTLQHEVSNLPDDLLFGVDASADGLTGDAENEQAIANVGSQLATLSRPISPLAAMTSRTSSTTSGKSSGPIKVSLTSLHPMQAPSKTSILYAAPQDPTNRLQRLGKHIRDAFAKHDLLVPDGRPLKLHATIVNTIYIRGKDMERFFAQQSALDDSNRSFADGAVGGTAEAEDRSAGQDEAGPAKAEKDHKTRRKKQHGPLRFDATAIIEEYKDAVWADDIVLDRVAICEMGAKDVLDDEGQVVDAVYKEVAVANLYESAASADE